MEVEIVGVTVIGDNGAGTVKDMGGDATGVGSESLVEFALLLGLHFAILGLAPVLDEDFAFQGVWLYLVMMVRIFFGSCLGFERNSEV